MFIYPVGIVAVPLPPTGQMKPTADEAACENEDNPDRGADRVGVLDIAEVFYDR